MPIFAIGELRVGEDVVDPRDLRCHHANCVENRDYLFGGSRLEERRHFGIERIAMLKHGVPDLRLYYENDLRFLEQFG